MRILLLMPEIGSRRGGGIQRMGLSLLRLLEKKQRERVIDCRSLAMGRPDEDADYACCGNLWDIDLRWYDRRRFAFCRAAIGAMALWADLVAITHLGLASVLPLLPRPIRPASITFIHGIEVWRRLGSRHRLAIDYSDYVIANSRFTFKKAQEYNPWLDGVRVCPLGIATGPTIAATSIETSLGFCPAAHDILIVGRMVKGQCQKGHRELIAAMAKVVAEVPDARLIIAGTGDDVDTYREIARRSPAANSILFVGFVPDDLLRLLYQHVGVFAMPSRQEGFGLVYAEAMAAGLPCVASTCDASGEVVVDGHTGFLVDPDDPNALACSLVGLLRDDDLRRQFGSQGRKLFEEQFSEERFHERVWGVIEEAIGIPHAGVLS